MNIGKIARELEEKLRGKYDIEFNGDQGIIHDRVNLIKAALQSAIPQWKPIDTAPRDGTLILLNGGVLREPATGQWNDDKYATNPKPFFSHDRVRSTGVIETRENQPTHWMPLPSEEK